MPQDAIISPADPRTLIACNELLELAAHRRKSEIEELLARRFPRPDVPAMVWTLPALIPQHAPGHVEFDPSNHGDTSDDSQARPVLPPPQAEGTATLERFLLQLTIGTSTRDKLRYAQALLSHAVPSGDVASVLDRALDALITQLEKRKAGVGTGVRLAAAPARARAEAEEQAAREQTRNVLAGLRNLGCRAEEARRAVAFTESLQGATLEERMRGALKFLSRRLDRQHVRGDVDARR